MFLVVKPEVSGGAAKCQWIIFFHKKRPHGPELGVQRLKYIQARLQCGYRYMRGHVTIYGIAPGE